VDGQGVDDDLGERHDPDGGLCLRRREVGRSVGHGDELSVDGELAAEEVDPVDGQAESLALPQPGPCGEGDQRPVPGGHGVC
jgi:hypothetical protein